LEPVHDVLSRFGTITQEAQEFVLMEMRKDMESDVTFNRAQLLKFQREITNLEIAEKNLLQKYIDPTARITQEMYDTVHQENQDKIERLKHEAKKYSELGSEYETSLVAIVSLAQRAKDIF
jgi:ribosomal protein S18